MQGFENKEAYRFIALDLDGTILDADLRVSAAVAGALAHMRAQGKKIIISTGRVYASARPHAEKAGGADAFVCSNGADIFDASGTRIATHHIDTATSRALVSLSRRFNTHFHGFLGDAWYYERHFPYTTNYARRSGIEGIQGDFDAMQALSFTKCMFMDEPARLASIELAIHDALEGRVKAMYSAPFMLELVSASVSKAAGLAEVLAGWNASLHDMIAFGDAFNDEEMLLSAGIGVAMGNAPEALKAKLTHIAPPIDKDGVALWLSDFFKLGAL